MILPVGVISSVSVVSPEITLQNILLEEVFIVGYK
jgi:hypothetical protein